MIIVPIRKSVVAMSKNVVSLTGKSNQVVSSSLQDKMQDIQENQGTLLSGEGLRGGSLRRKNVAPTKQKLQKFINLQF
jgi:hypothetical protein